MTLQYVPIVNLAPYFSGEPDGKAAVAQAVNQACKDIGFLVITEHRIPKELIDRVSRLTRQFFDLPLAEKRKVDRPSPEMVRGYSAIAEESLSYSLEESAPGDLKESFSIGPSNVPDEDYYHNAEAGSHFAPNVWPSQALLPGFKEAYQAYFDAMSELAQSLMRLFALALELDEHFFDDRIDRHISMFRSLSYPDIKTEVEAGQLRASAHTDYGSLTIVRPDNALGGLQVRNQQGEWVDVPYVENGFVVNIGDLMMQWTNDQWISTLHRVVNPPVTSEQDNRRQSLVFFHQPNYDTLIECLPGCLPDGATPRHAPVTSGDHLLSKFVKQTTFGGSKVA
ncbi:2-oxoglutarate and iron-dependent oxygenase domain-containing protein [Pseudomonas alliivorans]|nr:2-oxoglutarate and iron-dependent oxygenase domain-containing protein [Pseudomonas alliivorans]MEE4689242.1 2-oxoglutarate and iron-dependent oxygenase domain-containing protein [Pseudomonas alliivorans]MEE4698783.1 2-oxoglutarate and iron-dependent oxygenase domain-containing protein [Pseudomonas alliivorans]MEE4710113.1 2-oxoglutarate and iron-dependent oxygenase domain-containing protein [Pseudomonas alliivorans]MEE4718939.1 2-oxoglutarate and iron-dependent oxygenase domain-containing pr